MRLSLSHITLAAALMAAACSDNDQFRVNGTVQGRPNMNIRVAYYADGAYHTGVTAVREGEFEFFGSSRQPAIVEILDNDMRPLGRLYASNGETFEVGLDPDNPYQIKVSGNDISSRWADFLRANSSALSAGGESANSAIAAYIGSHPDDMVSTLLLLTAYDASADVLTADSLMTLIDVEARPAALTDPYTYPWRRIVAVREHDSIAPFSYAVPADDSLHAFSPAKAPLTLVSLSQDDDIRFDSIIPMMRRLHRRHKASALALLDLSADLDSATWRQNVEADTVNWPTGWAPGAVVSRPAVAVSAPSLPFFVVCDSTGRQLLRTHSPAKVERFISRKIR